MEILTRVGRWGIARNGQSVDEERGEEEERGLEKEFPERDTLVGIVEVPLRLRSYKNRVERKKNQISSSVNENSKLANLPGGTARGVCK